MMTTKDEPDRVPGGRVQRVDAGRRRVTAEEVARLAGVSRSAVSRAHTRGAYVSREKKRKILEAAEVLGYRPNALAAGLSSKRSNLVAVVTGNLKNHYDSEFVGKLVRQLNDLGKLPIVIGGTSDSIQDNDVLEALDYPLDAIVIRAGSVTVETVRSCLKLQVPVIVSGRIFDVGNVDSLCCDNNAGSEMAVAALFESGRKNIGYLGGDPGLFSEQERCAGFIAAMRRRRLEPVVMAQSDFSFGGGYATGLKILQGSRRPNAVFCGNDAMALGLLNAARETLGMRVPEDLSVIGFDDIEMSGWPCFNLSTIRNPVEPAVGEIVSLLESRFADPARQGQTIRIVPTPVLRGTH